MSFVPDPCAAPAPSTPPTHELPRLAPREVALLAIDLRGGPAHLGAAPADADAGTQALATGLSLVATLVQRHQGHLVQCTGQGLLAVFGLCEPLASAVEQAATCAVALQMAMRELHVHGPASPVQDLYLGMGLCAGPVVAGGLAGGAGPWAVMGPLVRRAEQLRAFSLRGQVLIDDALYQRCWGLVSASAPTTVTLAPGEGPFAVRELVAIPSRKLKVPRQEFRRSHRVPLDLPCAVQCVVEGRVQPTVFQARVRNLGYHGLQLAALEGGAGPVSVPLHGELRLALVLPGEAETLREVAARVAVQLPGGALGLEFMAPTPAFEARVRRCVQQQLALR